jgi:serine carboxypeptidase 1
MSLFVGSSTDDSPLDMKSIVLAALVASAVVASTFPEEFYGYIPQNVAYNSNFFYAIRGNSNATFRQNAPLVLFLQGGPGATSLFSDYLETGPEKLILSSTAPGGFALVEREHAWTNHANMLYVDNPIGTGFSYTDDPRGFSTDDNQIANNLVDFLTKFVAIHTEYATSPFWVFCESYGGKMTAYFGAALAEAIAKGSISVNFKGVALGDGWVDPVDCMYSYAPYLTTFSQINPAQAKEITQMASYAQNALEQGNGTQATNWWGNQQDYISLVTDNLNWYNSLYYYDYTADNQLDVFLATNFTAKLGNIIPAGVSYNNQSNDVFEYMGPSFMKDGITQVKNILDAGYQVNIYTGQVDLIVDVDCMNAWVKKLNWPYLDAFYASPRSALQLAGDLNAGGFVQSSHNLTIWNINKAGHMVPLDNPPYAELMMATIVGSEGAAHIKITEQDKAAMREGPFHRRAAKTSAKRGV